jgi:predicted DNA-binding transcriptional regulator AlpA
MELRTTSIGEVSEASAGASPIEAELIVGWRALQDIVPRSRAQISRDIAAKRFPAPIELGARSVAWWRSEVAAWWAARPRRDYAAPAQSLSKKRV